MSHNSGNAPAWLFSFLDLAFLVLIALIHLNSKGPLEVANSLGSIDLPEIEQSWVVAKDQRAARFFQVRVYPRTRAGDPDAFALVAVPALREGEASKAPETVSGTSRLSASGLRERLEALRFKHAARPILAPHRDSRSEDFLTALAIVKHLWPQTTSVAVQPVVALPSVSAAPAPRS